MLQRDGHQRGSLFVPEPLRTAVGRVARAPANRTHEIHTAARGGHDWGGGGPRPSQGSRWPWRPSDLPQGSWVVPGSGRWGPIPGSCGGRRAVRTGRKAQEEAGLPG